MRKVDETVRGSVLGKPGSVFIDNAWMDLLAKAPKGRPKTREEWRPPKSGSKGLDSCPYLPTQLADASPQRKDYLAEGLKKLAGTSFYGVCNDFAWVVTSLLVAPKSSAGGPLLPAGTPVELYGIVGRQEDKHLFTVVNRAAGSDPSDHSTWGRDCFVVDQWYALQTGTAPVKSLADGPYHDREFLEWWTATLTKTFLFYPKGGGKETRTNHLEPQARFAAGTPE
ncbi:MAG TPA: hypothetical protein VKP11_01930 [Frankiaceae bacterium]|nr:hypothetical protein [Frankiaceae bacterium]